MHPLRIFLKVAQSSQKGTELTATEGRNQVTTCFKTQVITLKTNKQKNPQGEQTSSKIMHFIFIELLCGTYDPDELFQYLRKDFHCIYTKSL